MDFYMIISNRDSRSYYPNNKPNDFRIHAPNINLKGRWYVGLCELTTEVDRDCEIRVLSDICTDTFIEDQQRPLLRRLSLAQGKNNVAFQRVMYIPILTNDFQSIRVFVEGTGALATDLTVLLHFKKYPFI